MREIEIAVSPVFTDFLIIRLIVQMNKIKVSLDASFLKQHFGYHNFVNQNVLQQKVDDVGFTHWGKCTILVQKSNFEFSRQKQQNSRILEFLARKFKCYDFCEMFDPKLNFMYQKLIFAPV